MNCAETKTLKMDDLILFGGRRQFVGNQENLAVKFCYRIFRKVLYFLIKFTILRKETRKGILYVLETKEKNVPRTWERPIWTLSLLNLHRYLSKIPYNGISYENH